MRRARTVLCPYCFHPWSTRVAAFRCLAADRTRCPEVADEALGRHQGIDVQGGRVTELRGRPGTAFETRAGKPVVCICGAATHPVCPTCHSRLPQLFTQHASRSMALIGTSDSGKTHFVVVALHELDHRVGPRFNGSLMLLDDHTRQRYAVELVQELYGRGMVLANTQSAANDPEVRLPLAARLTLGDIGHTTHTNLVFFDSAGEDLKSLTVLEREARYVTQSDGLILLIDPLQIPAVRDRLDGTVPLPGISVDAPTMLGRVVALMREARGISPDKPIETPLALAISKLDAIRPLLGDDHPALAASGHDGVFDRIEARNISDRLRADLAEWLGDGFDRFIQQNFSVVSVFGVSALGSSPTGRQLTHGVAPHRIEDPVLWMLDVWKAIPARG